MIADNMNPTQAQLDAALNPVKERITRHMEATIATINNPEVEKHLRMALANSLTEINQNYTPKTAVIDADGSVRLRGPEETVSKVKCPDCGESDKLVVGVEVAMDLRFDNNDDAYPYDNRGPDYYFWGEDSPANCWGCQWQGTLGETGYKRGAEAGD